ncbi:hypothetical protein CKM354_000636500 [Cercospora kikuchii]|uniref:Peptidase A1 domain-containing protein n=1 Tax=Cercospora kikuchii TaxID=84275 RepID=A0A9P3FI55_9PEZI|nr:uncharacterized protein CKM354_000636500 [Cercospora kikuchii]GIZ43125.1 hypothetical protein CKM354_000636500 [Cercospora kikuchii]
MALSIPADAAFRGNDGSWSTFSVGVGTPPQTVQLLPSTSGTAIWVVHEQGCYLTGAGNGDDPATCPFLRGNLFDPASSTSIQYIPCEGGPFCQLPTTQSLKSTAAHVGLDNITMTSLVDQAVVIRKQVVAAYAEYSMFLGLLGLSEYSNFVNSTILPTPSPLGALRGQNVIQSTFYAYQAGAYYRSRPGSLTFGGYDAIRGNEGSTLVVNLGSDSTSDLLVHARSINLDGDGFADNMNITMKIDSLVPEIWLPEAACLSFESVFGLVWNSTSEYYLINDTQRASLLARNAIVTFKLASNASSQDTIDISLPYAAFDLELSYPLANITDSSTTLRYFPLKRAADPESYRLGRTFLQEAYLVTDYDRRNFRLSAAIWNATGGPQLKTVSAEGEYAPIAEAGSTSPLPSSTAARGTSRGLIAGAVAGTIAALLILGTLAWLCWRKKRRVRKQARLRKQLDEEIEKSHTQLKGELDATETEQKRAELFDHARLELDGIGRGQAFAAAVELDDQQRINQMSELRSPREMEAPVKPIEMPTYQEETYFERSRKTYTRVSTENRDHHHRNDGE